MQYLYTSIVAAIYRGTTEANRITERNNHQTNASKIIKIIIEETIKKGLNVTLILPGLLLHEAIDLLLDGDSATAKKEH